MKIVKYAVRFDDIFASQRPGVHERLSSSVYGLALWTVDIYIYIFFDRVQHGAWRKYGKSRGN